MTAGALLYGIAALANRRWFFAVTLGLIVVLFNPLGPSYLRDKSVWLALDAVALVLLWSAAVGLRRFISEDI